MLTIQIILFLLSSFLQSPTTQTIKKETLPIQTVKPVVFIAGYDEGENRYYTQAEKYFREQEYTIIKDKYSLKEIVDWINQHSPHTAPKEVHIVSHSNPWRGLSMKATPDGERITTENLASYQNQIPSLNKAITKDLKIILHACGLGENEVLLKAIKHTIDQQDAIALYASPYFNVFGSPFSAHYLAEYYYVFYPTAHSPGRQELATQLATSYQTASLDWRTALETKSEEKYGMPYRYRFNIPVVWETEYDMLEYLPYLPTEEAIMDWVAGSEELAAQLLELNIPIEKFRWQKEVVGTTLIIKGKTTVQCVLKPITDSEEVGEYLIPDYMDLGVYVRI